MRNARVKEQGAEDPKGAKLTIVPPSKTKTKKKHSPRLVAQRGSIIMLRKGPFERGLVVSNNVQNSVSDFVLVVPMERRVSRLKAPFAIDLGRADGLRDLHSLRCDWVTRISADDIASIERAAVSEELIAKVEEALRVALGFRDVI